MRHSIYRKLQDSSKNTVVMSFVPSDGHLLQCVFDQNILLSDVHLTEYSIAYILWRSICQTGCCQKVLCVRHTIVFKLVWTAWLDGCNGWMHVIFFFFFLSFLALKLTSCKRIIQKLDCHCLKSVFLAGFLQRLLPLMSSPDSEGLHKFLLNLVSSALKLTLMIWARRHYRKLSAWWTPAESCQGSFWLALNHVTSRNVCRTSVLQNVRLKG